MLVLSVMKARIMIVKKALAAGYVVAGAVIVCVCEHDRLDKRKASLSDVVVAVLGCVRSRCGRADETVALFSFVLLLLLLLL
mmetsp:Transcript_2144/g.4803  ORF Transcript_2144/g.4803 Transcript_2144/m.4803 type:complete len:82 (+) Transcript_2144:138-383(+)